MTTEEIIASLISSYALGWAWATAMLAFKRLSETAT